MKAVVTGVAGFIGSTLAERLIGQGHTVVGIDSFTPYYDIDRKRENLKWLCESPAFEFVPGDLNAIHLDSIFQGADCVFHLAGQPGVRASWDETFREYVDNNINATHQTLRSALRVGVPRFVYASSSSVYGEVGHRRLREEDLPAPYSPYGVTKLAGEHLAQLYHSNYGLSTVALRFFSVYGPRQRPDMGINRFLTAALSGRTITLFGDGSQLRDFTYVGDIADATIAAATADVSGGQVYNIASGSPVVLNDVMSLIANKLGDRKLRIERIDREAGDVVATEGVIERAETALGWMPTTPFEEGLERQLRWHLTLAGTEGSLASA